MGLSYNPGKGIHKYYGIQIWRPDSERAFVMATFFRIIKNTLSKIIR